MLHTLSPFHGSRKKTKRVGRGHGSAHGITATRGTKGQRSRSGVSGLKLRGLRQTLLRVPKLRGFKSIHEKPRIVNLSSLALFESGTVITPKLLNTKRLVTLNGGKYTVKILGNGAIKNKLTIEGCEVSKSAKEKIEKAGGTVK